MGLRCLRHGWEIYACDALQPLDGGDVRHRLEEKQIGLPFGFRPEQSKIGAVNDLFGGGAVIGIQGETDGNTDIVRAIADADRAFECLDVVPADLERLALTLDTAGNYGELNAADHGNKIVLRCDSANALHHRTRHGIYSDPAVPIIHFIKSAEFEQIKGARHAGRAGNGFCERRDYGSKTWQWDEGSMHGKYLLSLGSRRIPALAPEASP